MVFVRLAGCNLNCHFCDTKYAFAPGVEMAEQEIVAQAKSFEAPWVCITGGEPFLQDLRLLANLLRKEGLKLQIETNGTLFQEVESDFLVVSPKDELKPSVEMLKRADEIKLIIDSEEALARTGEFEAWGTYHSVQPENNREDMVKLCVEFVKAHPAWRLSMQMHKLIGID